MRKWLYRLLPIIGLLLILITLTSALLPDGDQNRRKHSIALRQIGHDYLTATGDSTSLIPAVRERENGILFLALERDINYDKLVSITQNVVQRYDLNEAYTLSLEDCTSGEIFLGSLWPRQTNSAAAQDSFDTAACSGRDQEARCANISLAFHHATGKLPGSLPYLFFGLGCLLIFSTPVLRKLQPTPAPLPTTAPPPAATEERDTDAVQLGPELTFSLSGQSLRKGGEVLELTYREAKLLAFLAEHPNEVLERTTIHDAVWGEEGVIVSRSLDVFISRLRKKISNATGIEIQTVHGVGYKLWLK